MKAIFVGAGCSYGTLYGHDACPPLAKDFGSRLDAFEYPNLCTVANHLGKPLREIGMEELWTCIDYYAKFVDRGGVLPRHWDTDRTVKELHRALLELMGQGCDGATDEAATLDGYTLRAILEQVKPGDTIISFNWDTLVERLARTICPPLLHCTSRRPPEGAVRFAKPHGSAAWPIQGGGVSDGPPALVSLAAGKTPILLGAVPFKSELILEVQMHYGACDLFRVIMRQWQAVVDAVRDADEMIVLGYSFPKEDLYGRFLFKEGMRQRKGRSITIDYYDTNEAVGAAILETFLMKDIKIHLCWKGPVTPAWPK